MKELCREQLVVFTCFFSESDEDQADSLLDIDCNFESATDKTIDDESCDDNIFDSHVLRWVIVVSPKPLL